MRWHFSDLPCSSINETPVLFAGCAVTVLTAISTLPGTWAKGFVLVLTGSWLHKLWSKNRLGNLFSALYLLAIGLNIDHTAGFSASFLSKLPSVRLEHNTFQGMLKVPALLVEAVSGAHAKTWHQATSVAVCSLFPLKLEKYSYPVISCTAYQHIMHTKSV